MQVFAFLCLVGAGAFERDPGWREKTSVKISICFLLGGTSISAHAEQLSLVQRGSILIYYHQSSILKNVSRVLCLLHLLASMAAGQNAGFGFSPKLKAKKYHMSGTLHVISLALILYQTQQMFKGKPNTQTHNSHKIILIISGRQTIYSSKVTKRNTSICHFILFA